VRPQVTPPAQQRRTALLAVRHRKPHAPDRKPKGKLTAPSRRPDFAGAARDTDSRVGVTVYPRVVQTGGTGVLSVPEYQRRQDAAVCALEAAIHKPTSDSADA
jgi:hypothetical protein